MWRRRRSCGRIASCRGFAWASRSGRGCCGSCRTLALNEVRARGRRHGLAARFGFFAPRVEPSPDVEVMASDELAAVIRAIGELPPDDRVVLHLRYFLGLPEREMAAAIGKPAGTVKSRLHRASKRLRDVIEARYPGLKERGDG